MSKLAQPRTDEENRIEIACQGKQENPGFLTNCSGDGFGALLERAANAQVEKMK
jgi:hypothetical protein